MLKLVFLLTLHKIIQIHSYESVLPSFLPSFLFEVVLFGLSVFTIGMTSHAQIDCEAIFPPIGTEIVGNYNQSFVPNGATGGFVASILRPGIGNNTVLTNGFSQCSQGQLLFDLQTDGNGTSNFDLWLDIVDPRANGGISSVTSTFANANANGIITVVGQPATLNNVQVPLFNGAPQTVTRIQLRVQTTPGAYCGTVILNYNIVGANGADGARFTSSRLWYCPTNMGCTPTANSAQQVWDFETIPASGSKPPSAFSITEVQVFNGGIINAASAGGNNRMVILGNVVFNGANWIGQSESIVYMGPGSTLSFGNAASPPTNITVTNGQFFPCADQAFNTINVGPNTILNMVTNQANPQALDPIIYGANTGVTVQPGGSFLANGITIDGCAFGVLTNRASNLNLTNTQISYQGLKPAASRFNLVNSSGLIGVDIVGADLSFGPVHQLNNVTIQDQIFGVSMSGSDGGPGNPYRAARLGINGGSIINVRDGIQNAFNRNGSLTTTGLNIDADESGIRTLGSRGSNIFLSGGTIQADNEGVELHNSANTFMVAQGITVTGTERFGIRALQSPNSSVLINNNTITMPISAQTRSAAVSISGNINGQSAINTNDITITAMNSFGVSVNGNQNGKNGFNQQSVAVNNNQVAIGGTGSVGISLEDNSRGAASCNQVSNLIGGSGPLITEAFGLVANTNNNLSFNCNYLGEVANGVALIGMNSSTNYNRFAFHNNTVGLAVGLNMALSITYDEIGSNPQFPAFEYQGGISEDTRHNADPSMYSANRITARLGHPLYTPTTGDFSNWFTLITNNAPASNCGNCLGITGPWPIVGECPPTPQSTESEWTKLFKTRMNVKNSDYLPDDCEASTTCYSPLAQAEKEFEAVLTNTSFNFKVADALISMYEIFGEEGFSEEELNQIVEEATGLNSQDDAGAEFENDLSTIRTTLIDIETCSQEGELWKQSLDLSIKSFLPEGLSAEDTQILIATAEECSVTKGPGVYLARRTLGVSSNDATACVVVADSENLTLITEKIEVEIYPSPATAGSVLTTRSDITSDIALTSIVGSASFVITPSGQRSFTLPSNLIEGMYVVSYQSGNESITAKIQIIE